MSKVKLMIELSQEEYEFLKDLKWVNIGRGSCKTIQKNVINAIKFGTPLPKGHGDLIDRSKLEKDCDYNERKDRYTAYDEDTIAFADVVIPADKENSNGAMA